MSPLRTSTVWVSAGSGCSWPGMEQPHVSHITVFSLCVLALLRALGIGDALKFYAGEQQFVSADEVDGIAAAGIAKKPVRGRVVFVAAGAAADPDPDGFDHQPGLVSVIAGAGNGKGAFEQIGLHARKCPYEHGNGADAASAVLLRSGTYLGQQFIANGHFVHFQSP